MFRIIRDQGLFVDEIRLEHIDGRTHKVISDRTFPRDKGFWHNLAVRWGLAHDTMVVQGFQAVINFLMLSGQSGTSFSNIGIGTGTTPALVSDTQLQIPLVIKAATATKITTTNSNDTMQLVYTFSSTDGLSGATVAVTEVIVANGTVNGSSLILMHQVYSPSDTMNWDQGDMLRVTVKMQAKQG